MSWQREVVDCRMWFPCFITKLTCSSTTILDLGWNHYICPSNMVREWFLVSHLHYPKVMSILWKWWWFNNKISDEASHVEVALVFKKLCKTRAVCCYDGFVKNDGYVNNIINIKK